jgi:hypothetical protein
MWGRCVGQSAYDAALAAMTQGLPATPGFQDLVRYATLAASGHNAQPWRFVEGTGFAEIHPDFSRRTPVVDPDDHHLFASLGGAAENFSLAAKARGLSGEIRPDLAADGRLHVDLTPGPREETSLFAAIPSRQCNRGTYDGRSPPPEVLNRMVSAAAFHDVRAVILTESHMVEKVLELVVEGNSRQIADAAFVAELKSWLRFNASAAAQTGDGLYSASTGNPSLPAWLGPLLFDLFFTQAAENRKAAGQIRSSAGLVLLVAGRDDRLGWVSAGRAYQRLALQATVDGLQHAFINQPVEVPEVRRALQSLLGLAERRPNLLLRFGYGPALPRSLRRSPGDVILRE